MSVQDTVLDANANSNVKTIVFTTGTINKNDDVNSALIYVKRERKERVETETWGLTVTDLSFTKQLMMINRLPLFFLEKKDKYSQLLINHIKTKIHSYRHQDNLKKKYNEIEFIDLDYVINLLIESELKCHYCACETYLLYEIVREMKQWSLDRINNDLGHNKGNLVMACLECNLKRRRTNKDAFFITKNLTITREGI